MLFYYDKYSSKPSLVQYEDFLDNQVYLGHLRGNVKDVANYQLLEIRKGLANLPDLVRGSVEKSTRDVCGTLENGFEMLGAELSSISEGIDELNWQLSDISTSLEDLHWLLDERMAQMVHEQKMSNVFLKAIAENTSLPDSKKASNHFNRFGLAYIKRAENEHVTSAYDEALEAFTEAYKADKYDHICTYNLGLIYLNSKRHLNVKRAAELFAKSSELALILDEEKLSDIAASAFYYESTCHYILQDLPTAIKSIKKALQLYPKHIQYRFQLAKCMAASDKGEEAVEILREILLIAPLYSIEVLKDRDLSSNPSIQKFIEQESIRVISIVDNELEKIKAFLDSNHHQPSKHTVYKIEKDYRPKTYLSAIKAMESLKINAGKSLFSEIMDAVKNQKLIMEANERTKFEAYQAARRAEEEARKEARHRKLINIGYALISVCVLIIVWTCVLSYKDSHGANGEGYAPEIHTITEGDNDLKAGVAYKFYTRDQNGNDEDYRFISQHFQGEPLYNLKYMTEDGWVQIIVSKSDTYSLTITPRPKRNFWTGQPE